MSVKARGSPEHRRSSPLRPCTPPCTRTGRPPPHSCPCAAGPGRIIHTVLGAVVNERGPGAICKKIPFYLLSTQALKHEVPGSFMSDPPGSRRAGRDWCRWGARPHPWVGPCILNHGIISAWNVP